MKYYVIHYTKCEQRKRELIEREPWLRDATWVTKWDREDFLCDYVKYVTKSPLCLNYISLHLKHLEVLHDMVENDIKDAIIFEDDVVFQPEWKDKFDSITIPEDVNYVKLGCLHSCRFTGELMKISNNGGTEATYVKLPFANSFINDVSFLHTIDIVQWGHLTTDALYMIPLCNQTSIICANTSSVQTEKLPPWQEVIQYYKQVPKYKYTELLKQYEEFKIKKQKIEQLFEETYGQRVDIRKIDYVYKNELL